MFLRGFVRFLAEVRTGRRKLKAITPEWVWLCKRISMSPRKMQALGPGGFLSLTVILLFWLCWVFVAVSGLFSSCGERGLLFFAVGRLLIAVASLVAEHGL